MTNLADLNQRVEVPEAGLDDKAATSRKLFFSTQYAQGASEAYTTGVTASHAMLRAPGVPFSISWTPEVASWWEVVTHASIVRLDPASILAYCYLQNSITPAPNAAGPAADTQAIYHHNSDLGKHVGREVISLWALNAGVAYTCRAYLVPGSSSWSYHMGAGHMLMYGRGWAR
jgi:hypothetical protein